MVNFYVRMIRTGKMTLEEVKERWRANVAESLEEE